MSASVVAIVLIKPPKMARRTDMQPCLIPPLDFKPIIHKHITAMWQATWDESPLNKLMCERFHQLLAVGRWFPPGAPVSSTRKLISSSFHRLDMTLAVAEALNPNKPNQTNFTKSHPSLTNHALII